MGHVCTYVCTYCGAVLKSRSGYNRHVRVHEQKAPYNCCGKAFFDKAKFRMHRCSKHGSDPQETCDRCGKSFATRQQLQQHISIVHEKRKYKCDLCDAEFKAKRSLENHISKHNGEKKLMCRCGRRYQYASGLYRHRRDCTENIGVGH